MAQLVVESILEVGVHPVEDLSETQRGNRGFGYSGHEEAYPWAEPDDPLYQRQELGTRNPVGRISIRTLRVGGGSNETVNEVGTQTEEVERMGLSHGPQGDPGLQRVHDSDLWCRGAYDVEAEERRSEFGPPDERMGSVHDSKRAQTKLWRNLGDDGL